MSGRILRQICAALLLAAAAHAAAAAGGASAARQSWPMRQGLHEYSVAGGKAMLVVGSYQDSTSFWRSYQLYMVTPAEGDWIRVPLVARADHMEFDLVSSGAGDDTLDDWVAVKRGATLYLVRALKRAQDKGEVKVTWHQLVEWSEKEPDMPGYYLKPVFTRSYSAASRMSVDKVLEKELTLQPSK